MKHMENNLLSMTKILIISHNSLSMSANNGKTLESIFDCFPRSSIAQLYFQSEIPNSAKFNKFYKISDLDIVKGCLKYDFDFGETVDNCIEPQENNTYGTHTKLVNNLKSFGLLKGFIREVLYTFNISGGKNLNKWIDEFNPTAIFVLGGNSTFLYKIALELSTKKSIPLHVFFTDDFILNKNVRWFNFYNKHFLKVVKLAIKHSKSCFCISEKMSNVYKAKFSKEFSVLNNAVNTSAIVPDRISESVVKFVYAGGLTLGRDSALLDLCSVLSNIALYNKNIEIILSIYSANELSKNIYNSLMEMKALVVNVNGFKTIKEMNEVYQKSDFLLHVESSKAEYKSQTYLSLSTKISECLLSKRCLVAFGPVDIASMEIIEKNNIGIQLDSSATDNHNAEKLLKMIMSDEAYSEMVNRGHQYAVSNFSKASVQGTLLRNL